MRVVLGTAFLTVFSLYIVFQRNFVHSRAALVEGLYPSKELIEKGVTRGRGANETGPLFHPPIHTEGRYIVDQRGKRFKLASVNWYGASDMLFIPGGLDVQHRDAIAKTIRRLGFNSVRLPYSDEMVRSNPDIAPELLVANADLVGSSALEVYHAVVEALTDAGLAVIVNNHITQARWCCDANLCDATWSNEWLGPICRVRQTEEQWVENWETIMLPHRHNPFVVGADLRNEVRNPLGRFLWGTWAAAAEKAAERLLDIQPNWLMFIEGVSSANDVSGAQSRPIELSVPNRVVYSAHVYGWSGWGALDPYANRAYDSFAADMQANWAYLLEEDIAPVWVGELGVTARPNEGDLHYWKNLMRFLEEVDADFGYWAINPRKPRENEKEWYGLVEDDWVSPIWDYRIHDLNRLARMEVKTKTGLKVQPMGGAR